MRKWMLIILSALVLLPMVTGFTLAKPEATSTPASGDVFCGLWLVYDREENMEAHTFDPGSEAEQALLIYRLPAEDGGGEPAYTSKTGAALGEVSTNMHVKDDVEEEVEIKGTLYVIPEKDQDLWQQADHEMWFYEDVVNAFAGSLQKPEGTDDFGYIKPGQTALVYISPEQMEAHGQEMMDMAQKAGVTLLLGTQSPRHVMAAPVFMRPDGTLYADANNRHRVSITAGTTAGFSMSVENTETINGKTTKKRVTANLSVKTVDTLKAVRMVEMGKDNTPVKTEELSFDALRALALQQKPYAADAQANYVLAEETYETAAGESYIKRTVISPPAGGGTESFQIFCLPLDNGLTEAVSLAFSF